MFKFAKIAMIVAVSAAVFTGCASTGTDNGASVQEFRKNYNNRYYSNDQQAKRDDYIANPYSNMKANAR